MAPKKLPAKRSRKDVARKGSSAAPQADVDFDRHRFWSEEHQQRFEAIKGVKASFMMMNQVDSSRFDDNKDDDKKPKE